MMRAKCNYSSRGETVVEQTSTISESSLATPWQRRSNLGARGNYESTVPATLRIRYEFRGRNSFKGGGGERERERERVVTPRNVP